MEGGGGLVQLAGDVTLGGGHPLPYTDLVTEKPHLKRVCSCDRHPNGLCEDQPTEGLREPVVRGHRAPHATEP